MAMVHTSLLLVSDNTWTLGTGTWIFCERCPEGGDPPAPKTPLIFVGRWKFFYSRAPTEVKQSHIWRLICRYHRCSIPGEALSSSQLSIRTPFPFFKSNISEELGKSVGGYLLLLLTNVSCAISDRSLHGYPSILVINSSESKCTSATVPLVFPCLTDCDCPV